LAGGRLRALLRQTTHRRCQHIAAPSPTMPTVDKLVQGAKHLKVKEVPGYVSKFAGEHWTPDKTRSRLANWMDRYKVQVRAWERPKGEPRRARARRARARRGTPPAHTRRLPPAAARRPSRRRPF
jgi:hypothetical protein